MFSIASILTMAACIFLVGVFYSLVTNVDNIAQKVEQEVPVTVFFEEGTTEEQMQEVGNLIQARPEVERVEFESAEQAWENFKDKYFQGSDAAEGFKDDNPLVNSSNYHVFRGWSMCEMLSSLNRQQIRWEALTSWFPMHRS